MFARLSGIVIDCPDPQLVAVFYESLLGMERSHDAHEWVTLADLAGGPTLSFQRVEGFSPPDWTTGVPAQQLHLDLLVGNLDEAEQTVLALGGRMLEGSDKPVGYRVYADPVGHPFCLVTPEGLR